MVTVSFTITHVKSQWTEDPIVPTKMFKISIFLFQLTRIFSQFTLQFPSSLSISLFVVSENIRSHCIAYLYSRLQKKYRAMLINFWTFFQGLCSLLQRVMNVFFSNIHYLMLWMMPISTGESRLSPPVTTGTPNVFHLPVSLLWSFDFGWS